MLTLFSMNDTQLGASKVGRIWRKHAYKRVDQKICTGFIDTSLNFVVKGYKSILFGAIKHILNIHKERPWSNIKYKVTFLK